MPTTSCPAHPAVRLLLVLLACCLAWQGLALSARHALGLGHIHLNTSAARAALHEELTLHARNDDRLPFGGRLRSHRAPTLHDERQQHSHAPGMAGVVAVGEREAASPSARWATLVRPTLDLPGLLAGFPPPMAEPGNGLWRSTSAASAFDSRSTAPPLRPPRA